MPLKISSYRYGDPRPPGECLRIGTTRYLPRGVAKKDYARLDYFDAWLPLLAPGRELLTGTVTATARPRSFIAATAKR